MNIRKYAELIKVKPLNRIPYSDKPLPQSGEITYLSPEEFQNKFNCEYSESVFGDREFLSPFLNNRELCQEILKNPDLPSEDKILFRINNPLDNLIICKINDEVGCGLFTNADIPDGTIVAVYSGLVGMSQPFLGDNHYDHMWVNRQTATNAKDIGGIARFMQHLPVDKERYREYLKKGFMERAGAQIKASGIDLDAFINEIWPDDGDHEFVNLKFQDMSIKSQLATQNVTAMEAVIQGIPVTLIVAKQGLIKKGSQIGFSYGTEYWKTCNKTPRYFKNDGTMVADTKLDATNVVNQLNLFPAVSPMTLYKNAIQQYNSKNYNEAIRLIEESLVGFKKNNEQDMVKFATCYSTLASCYRELKQINEATECCYTALTYCSKSETASSKKEALLIKAKLEKMNDLSSNIKSAKFG